MARIGKTLATVTALIALVPSVQAASAAETGPGRVNLVRNATSEFDGYLTGSSQAQKQWIANTYYRIRGYDPFFDDVGATSWTGPSHYYEDIYALYRDLPEYQQVMQQHPDWVLRDGAGNRLFIPADCNGQTCTQYAADIGNPAYRAWWIAKAQETLAKGYDGIFVDDVNMDMKVANGAAQDVAPIDPRTGAPMTTGSWRRYMAEFTEQIASGLDEYEIVHNSHWWAPHSDPYVQRQTQAADVIELERGYNDGGLVGGGGQWGFETFMNHVDWVHSLGKTVILEPYGLNETKQEFELAGYFLTKSGDDAVAANYQADPNNFDTSWQTDLGTPLGTRYKWNGLWRRDYSGGVALVNQPDQPTRSVAIGPMQRLNGAQAQTVTLSARSGAVLLGSVAPGSGSVSPVAPEGSAGGSGPATASDDTQISVSIRAPRGKRVVQLLGRVEGASGGGVSLSVMQHAKGGWVRRSATSSGLDQSGRFQAKLPALSPGTYRVEAAYAGSSAAKASSTRRAFRVR